MLDIQRTNKGGMMCVHKIAILIVSLLLIYDYYSTETPKAIAVKDPKFSLLGPYNVTEPNFPVEDTYDRLINVTNFSFNLNPKPCDDNSEGILLMVIIASNPTNYAKRATIRNTWGRPTDSTKVVFLIGQRNDTKINNQILNESQLHGDIVQGNFVDAYRNMTYKHVMGLKWVSHHCPKAKYILKTDDDVVVNSHALRQFLIRELSPWGAKGLIACRVLVNIRAGRKPGLKWRVSMQEYDKKYYPTYCAGFAILYSQDVVRQLLKEAQIAKYFWIDDALITGILAEKIGVSRTPLGSHILNWPQVNMLKKLGPKYAKPFLFGPPNVTPGQISEIWKAISA